MIKVILVMLSLSLNAIAEKRYMNHEFKAITAKQAIVTLASNPAAVVYVMTELELSDKGTLRVKRVSHDTK